MTIDSVIAGSIVVSHTVAFTGADSSAASSAAATLATVLQSGDVSSVFGNSFGDVTVSGVQATTTTNPSKELVLEILLCSATHCANLRLSFTADTS